MTTSTQLGLAVLLTTALALAGCEDIRPPGFPHVAHLTQDKCGGEGQMDCSTCGTCHEATREGSAVGLPGAEICQKCHQNDTAEMMSKVRHGSQKRTEITFSHVNHLERSGIRGQCVKCHAGVVQDGVDGAMFPSMSTCLTCHQDGLQAQRCSSCHEGQDLSVLLPESFLRHDRGFFRSHGAEALRHQDVCGTCHSQSDCVRCHDQGQPLGLSDAFPDQVGRPLIHRADFVTRHNIEARSEPARCVRCHQPSFCDSCHLERGISANRVGAVNPHPIGWVGPDVNSPTFHGRQARRDILACAACHDAGPATNCIRCHKVGAFGGNPHPSGWGSLRSPDAPMCRYCHVP